MPSKEDPANLVARFPGTKHPITNVLEDFYGSRVINTSFFPLNNMECE